MGIETGVSQYLSGKFNEIRSRIPVKLGGFFSDESVQRLQAETFEEQLSKSAAALGDGSSPARAQDAGGTQVKDFAKSNLAIFPNIKQAPEETPEPEPAEQAGSESESGGGAQSGDSGLSSGGGSPEDGGAQNNGEYAIEADYPYEGDYWYEADNPYGSGEPYDTDNSFGPGDPFETGDSIASGYQYEAGYPDDSDDENGYADDYEYPDNYEEYGVGDIEWNAEGWNNYSMYGEIAEDDYWYEDEERDDGDYAGETAANGTEPAAQQETKQTARRATRLSAQRGTAAASSRELIEDSINRASSLYGIDRNLIRAVITQESSFRPDSLSSAGAQGLMQLMPETAASLGVKNPWDIYENIDGGTRLLRDNLEKYKGDLALALAAYNAGPGAVRRYNGVPPYGETRDYIKKVMNYYEQYTAENI